MLPTCIGISGVSRYRNDASIEDSFLPSAMVSSRQTIRDAFKVFLEAFFKVQGGLRSGDLSGLCIHRRPICNGKWPRPVKWVKLPLGLRQTVRDRP